MNKINVPALSLRYFELKIYRIQYKCPTDSSLKDMHFIAPDSLVAISAFSSLYPLRDIVNITFCSDCVSLYPTLPISHE